MLSEHDPSAAALCRVIEPAGSSRCPILERIDSYQVSRYFIKGHALHLVGVAGGPSETLSETYKTIGNQAISMESGDYAAFCTGDGVQMGSCIFPPRNWQP
jgi:hypothetical protein